MNVLPSQQISHDSQPQGSGAAWLPAGARLRATEVAIALGSHVRLQAGSFRSVGAAPRGRGVRRGRTQQQGAVLLVALVFLLLLTLLAVGASSGSLLQQRMVTATRSAQLATMAADAALRGAEWRLWVFAETHVPIQCGSDSINSTTGCVNYDPNSPLYAVGGAVTRFRTGNNAWLSLTGPVTYKGPDGGGFTNNTGADYAATANVARNPQYIIENMGPGGPSGEGGDTGSGVKGQPNDCIYRITARATGGSLNVVRVVQSTFESPCPNAI